MYMYICDYIYIYMIVYILILRYIHKGHLFSPDPQHFLPNAIDLGLGFLDAIGSSAGGLKSTPAKFDVCPSLVGGIPTPLKNMSQLEL